MKKTAIFAFAILLYSSAYCQEKNEICKTDSRGYRNCQSYRVQVETHQVAQPDNKAQISYIENLHTGKKIVFIPDTQRPTGHIYKYQNNSGTWTYSDKLPQSKSLIYYILE